MAALKFPANPDVNDTYTENGYTWQWDGVAWLAVNPSSMVYPEAGVAISTGTDWDTSKEAPEGEFVGTTDTQTLTNKTIAFGSNTLTDVASTNTTQTLTNKTINGSNNTITNVSLATAVTGTLPVANGGTGATTAANARTNLGAQETLVSGTNIKTVGGESLLGSGNIVLASGFSNIEVFTSSGTFTVPAGVTKVKVTVVGGGGNGGTGTPVSTTARGAGGGGGGGAAIKVVDNLTPTSTITVTVGGAGGTSSFGSHCSATGGAVGGAMAGGSGGIGSNGDLNIGGSGGSGGNLGGGLASGAGGNSLSGGGAAPVSTTGTAGLAGRAYGGGGSGGFSTAAANAAGGAGAAGVVIVEY